MTRALIIVALLAHSMLLAPLGCAWWNAKGKAEATTALQCAESVLGSQVATLVADVLAGNYAALASAGVDVLSCAVAALTQMPSSAGVKLGPGVVSRRDAAVAALRVELAKRGAK